MNLLEAVLSRQRTEAAKITLPLNGLLGAAGAVQSRAVRAAGYNSVVGLVVSDVPGTVTIMAAPETRRGGRRAPGTFVPIAVIPTAALGGVQAAQIDEEVRGDYIRVDYANGASPQTVFQFSAYLVPVFCFKRVDATVSGLPGADILASPDTPVGVAATVPLPVPPAGTRRMTVQNTGAAGSRIRVRELGGAAGAGVLLTSLGSTSFGGADGAIEALEAQEVIGVATTVAVVFEGD